MTAVRPTPESAHDGVSGDNVITSIGSLNRIDDTWLAEGRARFPALGELPSPRTAVLIGGPVADVPLDDDYIDGLLHSLSAWQARDGGSFLVTCSRRTPTVLAQRLREVFAAWPDLFWASDNDGANPYPGVLAWADRIIVTPDSSNLLSEASAELLRATGHHEDARTADQHALAHTTNPAQHALLQQRLHWD